MEKDQTKADPNFDSNLERLSIDSRSLLSRMPFDDLKVRKNYNQLYHILKKKNEKKRPIPEELKARK